MGERDECRACFAFCETLCVVCLFLPFEVSISSSFGFVLPILISYIGNSFGLSILDCFVTTYNVISEYGAIFFSVGVLEFSAGIDLTKYLNRQNIISSV